MQSGPAIDTGQKFFRIGQAGKEKEGELTYGNTMIAVDKDSRWIPNLITGAHGWRLYPNKQGIENPTAMVSLFKACPAEPSFALWLCAC